MKEPLILLDAGHGGLREGEYTTHGKQYDALHPDISPDEKFREGLINRMVATKLQFELSLLGIKSHFVSDLIEDTPLSERCRRANGLHDDYFCLYLSIHFNASQFHNTEGFEVFVSNRTKLNIISRQWANNTAEMVESFMPNHKLRQLYPARKYKTANHHVTRHTKMPAILVEGEFFDTRKGQENILMSSFIDDLVTCYCGGICKTLSDLKY